MALAALIALYSLAGGICLFVWGEFLWFGPYEYQIYGAISMVVGVTSLLLIIAFTNYSYVFTSALTFLLPFVCLISIVRAGVMIFRLNSFQDNVVWECGHDRLLYNATVASDPGLLLSYDASKAPATLCTYGFHTLYLAFAFALAIDCLIQLYQYFMVWRYRSFLRQYLPLKGPIATPIV
ncbi:hypothetical protein JCM8202v2_002554 [Rhodotorula sphaerocarpa]